MGTMNDEVVLEYTLTDAADPRLLTVGLRTRTLRAVQVVAALAGTSIDGAHVEVTANHGGLLMHITAAKPGRVDVYVRVGARGWRAALDEALEHKRRVPRVRALLVSVYTALEALHPGLLDDMCRVTKLMYADAKRLTTRDRLVVELRWAAASRAIPEEARAVVANLADLAAHGTSPETLVAATKAAAKALGTGQPGRGRLLAMVHEVTAMSGGSLDRR